MVGNTSCRCFYSRWVTSGDLIQPTLNQTNSGGLTKAPRCNVCKSRLLSRAAFKGHVFRCRGAYELLAEPRAPRTFITNLQVKRAEPEQPHFPFRAVRTRHGISGWACCVCTRGTLKFAGMKHNIHNLLASSRKTNERVGDSLGGL